MTEEALIHLRVPAALKARWVRLSRARGQRLTDWIIERVERSMITTIRIPDDLTYADLRLAREPDGSIAFDAAVLARVCEASGVDYDRIVPDEDALCGLLTAWYREHVGAGGAPDPVQEDLLAEIAAEDARGGGQSYPPGRA